MVLKILEFNGEADHLHTLIEFPHSLSISTIVNALKGVSSRRYGQDQQLCGAPQDVLKQYIQHQEKPS